MIDEGRRRTATAVLTAALIAGATYLLADSLSLTQVVSLTWKGAGVGLLAVYAALRARNVDGWLLCAVMTFGALGDVMLGVLGLVGGAVFFLIGHLTAILLFRRRRQIGAPRVAVIAAAILVPLTVATAYVLPADRAGAAGVAAYALGLSIMAATALLSRFRGAGLGALMFLVSDLLIFARAGALAHAAWIGFAIWGLYFAGQALICLAVRRGLDDEASSDRV